MLFHLLFLTLSNQAHAVPLQITQQGRILDNSGTTVVGVHDVTFRMYDTKNSGSPLWSETLVISFNNGYYAAILGTDESGNPLDSSVLGLYPLYLELQLDSNTPMTPRQEITSVPYAQMAGVAESVDGGTVNASEVQVGSILVIDGNRNWVGEPITVDWSQVQSIPSDLQDGDNDTQLSEGEVENFVTNGGLSLHEDTTLNGEQILTLGMDSDILADISCSDGDVPKWDAVVGQWDCGLDNDTLANLNCSAGELAKFDGTNWSCGEDIDTVLDADTVISYVEQNSLSIPSGSQIDGADILTSNDTLEPEWTDIQNRPNGLDDGDDDTQLSQSEVVGYVESGSVNLAQGSQVNSRNIVGQPSVCSNGQVLVYNSTTSDWECGDDSDTTLTPSEMQAAIEAMSLNLQNLPQVNGENVLVESSMLNPANIDASASTEGQVLISNGVSMEFNTLNTCTAEYLTGSSVSFQCGDISFRFNGGFTIQVLVDSFPEGYWNGYSYCALKDNVPYCWGRDNEQQISDTPATEFTKLYIGEDTFCGITLLGETTCWGRDNWGQISNIPTDTFTNIKVSGATVCGITDGKELRCWGHDGNSKVSGTPSGSDYESLYVGIGNICALDSTGYAHCWGDDGYSQVTTVPSIQFSSLSIGYSHICGIDLSSSIHCWGRDYQGVVTGAPTSGSFRSVKTSAYNSCALDNSGNVICWGNDNYLQVTNTPSEIFEKISLTGSHVCGLKSDGYVSCWGYDGYGQVSDVPQSTFTDINLRGMSSCGILTSGKVACWGHDDYNEVSDAP